MKFYLLLSLVSAMCIMANSANCDTPTPPVAKKQPKVTEIHGRKLVDPYAWLRNREAPEVMNYLKSENPILKKS